MSAQIFPGGVFSDALDGGRAGASLSVGPAGVRATTTDGAQTFELAFSGLTAEMGGASGRMIFLRSSDGNLTLFCEAPRYLDALIAVAPMELREQLSRMAGQHQRRRLVGVAAFVALLVALGAGVAAAPAMLRGVVEKAVDAIPYAVDEQIGKAAFNNMSLGGKVVTEAAITQPVQAIVSHLQPHAFIRDRSTSQPSGKGISPTLTVRVVDDPQVNAFALPGGYIVVYTGLLKTAESADGVAGVLAHEIAHVTLRHGIERLGQSLGVVGAVQLLLGDASGLLALASQMLTVAAINAYSRDQESAADREGVQMLHAAGIDAEGLVRLFARMRKQQRAMAAGNGGPASERDGDGSGGGRAQGEAKSGGEADPDPSRDSATDAEPGVIEKGVAWLDTHPDLATRIDAIRRQDEALGKAAGGTLQIDWEGLQRALGAKTTEPDGDLPQPVEEGANDSPPSEPAR